MVMLDLDPEIKRKTIFIITISSMAEFKRLSGAK